MSTNASFPSLNDGYYRYIRTKKGKVFWTFPNSLVFHRQLVSDNSLIDQDLLSAGFFEVRSGKVTLPQTVSIIDNEDKSNRSIGLMLQPWRDTLSVPDDLTLILQTLDEEVF